MIKKFLLCLQEEDGQTSTEYILLVAVAALLVMRFKNVAADRITSITNSVFSSADSIAGDIGK
ncbi:MAG: hypothetical protein HQK53_16665 [Oligoflexia bacterium]|nr:hypothetical protein [Oligoflexia bacterium]